MCKTPKTLPQLGNQLFLTDGGLETSLIFLDGFDLPYFAAFHLLRDPKGRQALTRYYERYIAIAKADGLGFILESPTWRANSDWGEKLGYSRAELAEANRQSVDMMQVLRSQHQTERSPMVVSGCVGPRGDGYVPGQVMSCEEAEAYHAVQIGAFAEASADMVTAITMTNVTPGSQESGARVGEFVAILREPPYLGFSACANAVETAIDSQAEMTKTHCTTLLGNPTATMVLSSLVRLMI